MGLGEVCGHFENHTWSCKKAIIEMHCGKSGPERARNNQLMVKYSIK